VARARKNPHPRSASGGQPSQQGKHFAKKSFGNKPARGPRENPPAGLKQQILAALADRAMDKIELSNAIGLPPDSRGKLREVLREMEVRGDIARIRKDRYVIPSEADLFTGVIQFHASGSSHVLNETPGQPDLFVSAENTLTAMHGDRVVARVDRGREPAGEWAPGRPKARHEGRVIRIVKRASDTIVGTLQRSKAFYYVVSDDPRFVHNLYVPAPIPPLKARVGDKVVAKLDDWPSRHVNPEGHIIEILGPSDSPKVGILSIIKKHHLPEAFPSEVIREAERYSAAVDSQELARRVDLRNEFIFTIDPDDARDFDDAINVEKIPGGWRVGVHIADVSHFVKPKSPLDREAFARGNSVYLADRVIPMLPEALSNGLCSLRPDEDHLTFSVFADINAKGKASNVRFAKTIIRSKARLTYKEAFARLQKPPTDELSKKLHLAWEMASLLRKRRFTDGSLDMDFPEVKVWLDPDGRPIRLEKVENDISHQLIEEMMLLANELVARELKMNRQPSVYRVHEDPDPDKLAEFREFAMAQGIKIGDVSKRPELQKLLVAIRGRPQEYSIKLALLKSLKRARYLPEGLGHYGLHKADYTHFTSPIRRYADLIVHRSLERRLGLTNKGPDSGALGAIAEHISTTERTAAEAEKESVRLKKLEYFQSQIEDRKGQSFTAQIIDVRNFGIIVELPDFLLTGMIHVSALEGDFYIFDQGRSRLVGRKTRKIYQTGQSIEVIVARVDFFKQQVDFRPA
jgi:ribonuclease R